MGTGSRIEVGDPATPGVENAVALRTHPLPRLVAIHPGHEQVAVVGVDMADRGGDGLADGGRSRRAAGVPGPAHRGVVGDCRGARGGAAGELLADGIGELTAELLVDGRPAVCACAGVLEALAAGSPLVNRRPP